MFSGIVEEKGRVLRFEEGLDAWKLTVEAHRILEGLSVGDSVAVNGCCLTAVSFTDSSVGFDLLEETVRLTSFKNLSAEGFVNLERSLKFNGSIGGHFVTGHIDCTGLIEVLEPRGKDFYLRIRPPEEFMHYLVYKGSIAIDGISLTVAAVDDNGLESWLIPHTMEVTNLSHLKAGDLVNLEFDLLAKYVEKLLPAAK